MTLVKGLWDGILKASGVALAGILLYTIWPALVEEAIDAPVTEIHHTLVHSPEEESHHKSMVAEAFTSALEPLQKEFININSKIVQLNTIYKTASGLVDISQHGDTPYFQPNRTQSRTGRLYMEGDKLCITAYNNNIERGRTCEVIVQGSWTSESYQGRLSKKAAELMNVMDLSEVWVRIEPRSDSSLIDQ